MKAIAPSAPAAFTATTAASSPFTAAKAPENNSALSVNPFANGSNNFRSSTTTSQANLPSPNPFASSQPPSVGLNPFSAPTTTVNGLQSTSAFGRPSGLTSDATVAKPFGGPSQTFSSNVSTQSSSTTASPDQYGIAAKQTSKSNFTPKQLGPSRSLASVKSKVAGDIERLLLRKGIFAPSWPTTSPGDPSQKGIMETFWQATKAYRAKVRTALIQSGQLDDPDKPKKLSEAIDFKGTCEEMCPEFEKITRIIEHDVQGPEKDTAPDGHNLWPSPRKMVKALARSAAGQDAPLPEDVRSPSALRRTLDYLIDTVLGPNELPAIHGFLWDRTRAIRRDFVFQQSSMSSDELTEQVYCLETITRFHVVALHQMSRDDVVAEDFSEQQEIEQLGKTLLSLIHAYEDCNAQGITCENEAEFRAYYVLFNSHNPGIFETVQDWGWKFWGESDVIRTSVCLVEALQNIWDLHGPLKPLSATNIAQNSYNRFFAIIEDRKVSYHMACFAEIYFNKVRKAALKTILSSYRKQKLQTEDWTLSKLNVYLRFDDEQDIIPFAEAYGLNFEERDGEDFLTFESDDSMVDPFPQLKQQHSSKLVERKRGSHSLPDVIHRTVFEEPLLGEEETFARDQSIHFPEPLASTSKTLSPNMANENTKLQSNENLGGRPGVIPFGSNAGLGSTSKQSSTPASSPFSFLAGSNDKTAELGTSPSTTPANRPSLFPKSTVASDSPRNSNPAPKSLFGGRIGPAESIFSPSQIDALSTPSTTRAELSKDAVSELPQITGNKVWGTPSQATTSLFPSLSSGSTSSPVSFIPPAQKVDTPASAITRNIPESKDSSEPSESITAGTVVSQNTFLSSQSLPSSSPQPTVLKPRPSLIAEWVVKGKAGLVDQFIEYEVGEILRATVAQFRVEETERLLREEEEENRLLTEQYRYQFLATKYGHMWRQNTHLLWLKRKGKEAREIRRQMAESMRASKLAERDNITEDFKATQKAGSLHKSRSLVRPAVNGGSEESHNHVRASSHKRRTASNSPRRVSKSPSNHSRNRSETNLRKSILADHMALPGSSRIHLLPNDIPLTGQKRRASGVQTDYFRLKARGITTLPDGTPLATMAAYHLPRKASFDGFMKPSTPKRELRESLSNSVPAKPVARLPEPKGLAAEDFDLDIEALKARAKKLVEEDREKRHQKKKRMFDDNDEELFARAKRIREQMDEGTEWFKSEIGKKSVSRSHS